jgi:hypothetical protein
MKLTLTKYGHRFLMESKEKGNYVGLPYNIIDGKRSELSEKVRLILQELDCPYVIKSDDESQDLLDYLSDYLKTNTWMSMPFDGEEEFLLKFSDNVIIHVSAKDEYLGMGEHETYSCISGLIITDNVTNEEIFDVVKFIKEIAQKLN